MKHAKRLASVLLAMVMVLAMGVTAFATEPEGDGGDNSSDGGKKEVTHTYEIYQIFTGDYSEGVLSNIKWGKNGDGTEGEKVDKKVLEALEAVKDATSDTEKLEVINKYANLSSTPIETGSGTKYTNLKPGYYLVKDKDGSLNGTEEAYTLYVVQVVNDTLEFIPKSDVPEVDKKIVEDGKEVENNSASIGDEVNYEITGTLPSNYDAYTTYYYKFSDTLSKGLTYKEDSLVITIDETETAIADLGGSLVITKPEQEPGETKIEVTIPDLKKVSGVTKDSKIVITYTAVLNEYAASEPDAATNKVKVEYSNDPNKSSGGTDDPKGVTPEDKVTTLTTELEITKRAEKEDGEFLPGVEFTLTGEGVKIVLVTTEKFVEDPAGTYYELTDGTYTETEPGDNTDQYVDTSKKYKRETELVAKGEGKEDTNIVGIVGQDGKVAFTGLGAGEYTLEETKTPDGYNTIDPIKFTIKFDPATQEFSVESTETVINVNGNKLTTTIVNTSGSLLPSTGGIGTTIFYIVGGVLVVGAAILLIAKKRAK